MLQTLMGEINPWEGKVFFVWQVVSVFSAHEIVERGLVLVPEGRLLFTDMTVFENLEMGASPGGQGRI